MTFRLESKDRDETVVVGTYHELAIHINQYTATMSVGDAIKVTRTQ